jgi:GNAT superfamily N-acetyltransferase
MPAVTLHAYAGIPGIPAGALLTPGRVPRAATTIGSVRWWIRSGLVDAVRVEPAFRGAGYGWLLVHAAEGLRALRGWAPLRADGRLTDTAAAWLGAAPPCWAPRLTARTLRLAAQPEPGTPTGVQRLMGDLPSRLL